MEKKSVFGAASRRYPAPSPNLGKILLFVVIGVVAELILTGIGKYYGKASSFGFMYGLVLVLAVLFAAAAVYFIVLLAKAVKSSAEDVPLYGALTLGMLGGCASFLILRFFWTDGLKVLYVLWAGVTVLGILSQIYYPEFVCLAGLTGLSAVGCFAAYRAMAYGTVSSTTLLIAGVLVAAALVVACLTLAAGKNGGTVSLLGSPLKIYSMPGSKLLLYVTALVVIVCAVLGLVLGAAFCYYCFFVAVAWLLLSAAYYTIRLM